MTNFPNYHYQNQGGNNGPKARYNSNLIMSEDAKMETNFCRKGFN